MVPTYSAYPGVQAPVAHRSGDREPARRSRVAYLAVWFGCAPVSDDALPAPAPGRPSNGGSRRAGLLRLRAASMEPAVRDARLPAGAPVRRAGRRGHGTAAARPAQEVQR